MQLSEEKTLITHSSEHARFLGYDVSVRRCGEIKRGGPHHAKMRTLNNKVELLAPLNDNIHKFIFSRKIAKQNDDGTLCPVHRSSLLQLTDLEIVSVYNAELRGICNYYGMASNFNKLSFLSYLMEYSCYKTLANKHKSTISKVKAMYKDGNGGWGIPYETKTGQKRRYFAKFADCKGADNPTDTVSNAAIMYGFSINTLENRLKAKICELCGTTESDHYEIHHVNKLKNLKGKQAWEKMMIAKRRKTLVVCRNCHKEIHK
jgi:protein-arginine kinase activator protein McsA